MLQPTIPSFTGSGPKAESNWRGVVLLGRNVQSYKFALARTVLDIAASGKDTASLEQLALPFAEQLCTHLKTADKQGTPTGSPMLDACRKHNQGELGQEELQTIAIREGFDNVLDAFHIVGGKPVPTKFFDVSGRGIQRVIHLTDEAISLAIGPQATNLRHEVDARWRLVETAWELGVSTHVLSTINYSHTDQVLYVGAGRRKVITGVRGAISGYQKGRCFYCYRGIEIGEGGALPTDVDHVVPHRLQQTVFPQGPNLDGVWNLVLACQECNRGKGGKSDRLPPPDYRDRLWQRNEYYILSHHPLRETLMQQMGSSQERRVDFLGSVWKDASGLGIPIWTPAQLAESVWQEQV